jgi:hypothetical protein
VNRKAAYLVYSEKDAEFANTIKNATAQNLSYLQGGSISEGEVHYTGLNSLLALVTQQNAFEVIKKAGIVIALLSPDALSDEKFVFYYNYLHQCNRPVIVIISKNTVIQEMPNNFYPIDLNKKSQAAAYVLLLKYIEILPGPATGSTGFQDFTRQNNSGNFNTGYTGGNTENILNKIKSLTGNPTETNSEETTNGSEQGGGSGTLLDKLQGEQIAGAINANTDNAGGSNNLMDLIKGFLDGNDETSKVKDINTPAVVKGKILYDIPDNMQLQKQEKCIIRIGKNEVTVKSTDVFSAAAVTEDIKLSGLMKVELIDIANIPNFTIKTISTPSQEVDDDEFTEWLFYVTPINTGLCSLILKVSAIKNAAGREKIKDIVFEKNITINTGMPESLLTTVAFASSFNTPVKSEQKKTLRDVMSEPLAKYMESPDVFISYAHDDRLYFEIFEKNLRAQSGWNVWTDRNIQIGSDWFNQIQQSLTVCNIAVLLISANFFSSAFIKEHEYRKLREMQNNNPAVIIIPVLLRDVDISRWEELTAIQFFSAHYYEYGKASDSKSLMPFAMLCEFDKNGLLIPNAFIDTYFKNLVQKVQNDWLRNKLPAGS